MLECQKYKSQAGKQLFISPSNKQSRWLFHWTEHGATGRAAGEPPDARTQHLVFQMTATCQLLNLARRSLTVTFKPPDMVKWEPDASDAHRTHTQRRCFSRRVTRCVPPDAPQVSDALSQKHSHSYKLTSCITGVPTVPGLHPMRAFDAHCSLAPETDNIPDTYIQHPMPWRLASGPTTSPNFPQTQQKICVSFSQIAESHLASSVEGREEPKPFSTLQTPPPS